MLNFLKVAKPWYAESDLPSPQGRRCSGPWLRTPLWTVSTIICCVLSFVLGRHSVLVTVRGPISLSENTYTFKYNRTFGERPSPKSDAAWAELFPEYGGYLTHPQVAPTRSAVAVFHQLHCLNSIRKTLWTAYTMAENGTGLKAEDLSPHMSPPHMRHCIDLLRQSMMCQPDLTVEVYNEELGGVTGFGTTHKCRNWNELFDFVSDWERYGVDETEAHG